MTTKPAAKSKQPAPARKGAVAKAPAAKTPAASTTVAAKVGLKELSAMVHAKLPLVAAGTISRVVEETFAAMTSAYAGGDIVNIKDFGKLSISDRPARTGRNPQTGEPVDIAAKRVPKFAFAKAMKDAV
jgi:DNA-binding protein HU-beta